MNKKISLALFSFFVISLLTSCGNNGAPTNYKFNFVGSDCSLNNEKTYRPNQVVNLSFTVNSGFELPDTIDVVGVNAYDYSKSDKTLSLTMTDDVTVVCYAKRIEATYEADFYIDGKIQPELKQNVRPDQFVQRPETPVKEKFVFDGWYTNSGCTGAKYSFNALLSGPIQLYGVFKQDEDAYYDITFDANDTGGYFNNDPTCKSLTYSYKYGTVITNAPIPYKPSDGWNSYVFDGWNLEKVSGPKTYKAGFTPSPNTYTVRWLNYDLTVLETDSVGYGDLPKYDKETPTRNDDFEGSYKFVGWTPEVVPVINDAVYFAQYELTTLNSSYPQTLLTDQSIISELDKISIVDDKGYKTYNDTKYYEFTSLQKYVSDDGTTVNANETNYYKVEPIKWKTLKIDYTKKERLVVSEKLLDATTWQEYFEEQKQLTDYQGNSAWVYCNNYKYSLIRTFLNTTFLNRAFTNNAIIQASEVDNSPSTTRNTDDNPYACENTNDKLFLLSYKDMTNTDYFADNESRKAEKTDFARANKSIPFIPVTDYFKYGEYATRSPRKWQDYATYSIDSVSDTGDLPYSSSGMVMITSVRPAILAKL